LGILVGIIRDSERFVDYFYISSSDDAPLPVNGFTVTLNPGNRVYNGDDLNNGFFLLDSLVPGSYQLVYEAQGYITDTSNVDVIANQVVFADKYLQPFTPDTPQFVRILWQSATSLQVMCDPAARATGYTVFYGTNGTEFPDSVSASDPDIFVSGLEPDSVYYFKVKATNQSGSSQLSREVYAGVPSANPHSVLIVNGFDRPTNTRFDYIRKYADPLNQRGYPFSYTLNETVESGKVSLLGFETIIWILGDESTADHTFTPTEQDLVAAFLDNGGRLFVSGAEIGWDLWAQGNSADRTFYTNYMKAQYVADAAGGTANFYYSCEAISGEIFNGISDFNFDNGTHGTFQVDWPDAILGVGIARNILRYKNAPTSNIAGISFEGMFPNATTAGKLVYLGIPFETIYPDQSRMELMDRIFNFFEDHLQIETSESGYIPNNYVLEQNYPNPFNPLTQIQYEIKNPGFTTLRVYDNRGRLVNVLVEKMQLPGRYQVEFDGSRFASGPYFYILESRKYKITRKMILLK
jgi:hypothetical protein